jgi:predicted negative regulator of RcsB-dependent stress response
VERWRRNCVWIYFDYFLSTSTLKDVSLGFAIPLLDNADAQALFFVIDVDPRVCSVAIGSLDGISFIPDENEILFGMSTIFRVNEVQVMESGLWVVNLTLTSDNDPQLRRLSEYMRDEVQGIGVDRLGKLMLRMGESKKAKDIYETLLQSTRNDDQMRRAHIHHHLGCIAHQRDELDDALGQYQQSLCIFETHIPESQDRLLVTLINTGAAFHKKGNHDQAIENYQQALHFLLKAKNPDPQRIVSH